MHKHWKWQVSRNNAFLGSSQYNCPWHSRFTPSAFRRRYFFLKQNNFNVIVRNSGGLAVVLDEGVLNVSLLFQETEKGIDIDLGYDTMWHLIKEMLKDYDVTIEAKEIVGSYCPGSYDLSIRIKNSLVFHNVVFAEVSLSKSISALPEVALSVPHSFVISTTQQFKGRNTLYVPLKLYQVRWPHSELLVEPLQYKI